MSEIAHTPGPWYFDTNKQGYGCEFSGFAVHSERYTVATVITDTESLSNAANARLIASAPELLKSLIQITDIYAEMRATLSQKYPQDGWSAETMTIDQARAAIAKAIGQPRFPMTYCSQCGCECGPGDEGVSSCKDHK